ncbi:hypothetical protein D5086_007760 [Populus alba]|uniref:Uncharacterized protein n=1 Tax=Populus alba TaxID=43335 RepID=A0ACC4CDM4_POPAL
MNNPSWERKQSKSDVFFRVGFQSSSSSREEESKIGALNNALWILLVYFTYNSKLGKQQIASSRVVGLAKAMMP